MKHHAHILLLCCLCAWSLGSRAQTYYACDFEDAAERSQWVLNNGNLASRCPNKWYIGAPGSVGLSGSYGLYISGDQGATSNFVASTPQPMYVVAYRDLTLPVGSYTITFDWYTRATGGDRFYVCLVPQGQAVNSNPTSADVPAWVKRYKLDSLQAAEACQTYSKQFIVASADPMKLVFVWWNTTRVPTQPAAIIDNLEIYRERGCEAPKNLSYTLEEDRLKIHWEGNASTYQVRLHQPDANTYLETTTQADSCVFSNLEEGVLGISVRSVCGNTTSEYVSIYPWVWFRGRRCVEYLDLDAANCYVVKDMYNDKATGYGENKVVPGKIDHGYASMASHHTIHYLQGEYDENTEFGLRTVPEGSLASIRLGNMSQRDTTNVIEYTLHVDSGSTDLLKLRYAMVLEAPVHDDNILQNPHFRLVTFDGPPANNDTVHCASILYVAQEKLIKNEEGWHETNIHWHDDSHAVWWRDWEDIGISLKDYIGHTLTIRFEMHTCSMVQHGAYGYFVIDCESGEMSGMNCEDWIREFTAPDAFDYRWYRAADPEKHILSYDQTFHTASANDTTMYACDIVSSINTDCYYTYLVSGMPRYAVPDVKVSRVAGCTNDVLFENNSYIVYFNPFTGDSTLFRSTVDSLYWDFGDGSPVVQATSRTYQHNFPRSGGDFVVRLRAVVEKCPQLMEIPLHLPDLSTRDELLDIHLCEGESYTYEPTGQVYTTTALDTFAVKSLETGCDSLVFLSVTVHDTVAVHLYDTVCSSDLPYMVEGQRYTSVSGLPVTIEPDYFNAAGTYRIVRRSASSGFRCDSTIVLHLQVISWDNAISVTPARQVACYGDATAPFSVSLPSISDSLYVRYSDAMHALGARDVALPGNGTVDLSLPVDTTFKPGIYTFTLSAYNRWCGWQEAEVSLEVRYPAGVLQQKWNDVVSVLNRDHNGGFSFVSFQWYANGLPLVGENRSYIYLPDTLTMGAEYSVLLTEADGRQAMSCPIVAVPHTDVSVWPTLLDAARPQQVSIRSRKALTAAVYGTDGRVYASGRALPAGESDLTLSLPPGMFLLRLTDGQGREAGRWHLVVK